MSTETIEADVRRLREAVGMLARCVADLAELTAKGLEGDAAGAAQGIGAEAATLENI
jgi:hypothetical protein